MRIAKGITQKDLAKALSVTFQAVSLWEKDKTLPDIENIKQICKFFGESADYLLGLED